MVKRDRAIVDLVIPFVLKFLNIDSRDSSRIRDDSVQDIEAVIIDLMAESILFSGVKGNESQIFNLMNPQTVFHVSC